MFDFRADTTAEQQKKEKTVTKKPVFVVCTILLVCAVLLSGVTTLQAAPPTPAASSDDVAKLEQFWQQTHPSSPGLQSTPLPLNLSKTLLAKAKPDECFSAVGSCPTGKPDASGNCAAGSKPKVNEAYVWGLAKSGSKLWFGTAPNVHCLVIGGYLGMTTPITTTSFVCEFGQSCAAQANPALPDSIGDWRPPTVYRYNLNTKALQKKTPADARIATTVGLRSAGTLGKIVFLGGPSLLGGINLFGPNSRHRARAATADYQYVGIKCVCCAGQG